jgi:hypothetical protein
MSVTTRHDPTGRVGPVCAAAPARLPVQPPVQQPVQPPVQPPARPRRVRQEVREGMAVVVFSAVASTGVALVLLLLMSLVG